VFLIVFLRALNIYSVFKNRFKVFNRVSGRGFRGEGRGFKFRVWCKGIEFLEV